MTALLGFFLSNPTLVAIMASVVGAITWGFHQRLAGAKAERHKQAVERLASAQDRLEMDREATAAEREAAGMTDDAARKEAKQWAKR